MPTLQRSLWYKLKNVCGVWHGVHLSPLELPVVMKGDEEKTIFPKVGSEQVAQPAGRGGVNDDCVPGTISCQWWKR